MKNIIIILALILVAAILSGCTGQQGVSGATCYVETTFPDGTKCIYRSDSNFDANEISFDKQGTFHASNIHVNRSDLGIQGQLPFMVQQSNNATQIALALLSTLGQAAPYIVKGGGALMASPTGGISVVPATTQPSK